MANTPPIDGGLDNWVPPSGGAWSAQKEAALLSTDAVDSPDTVNPPESLKRFVGKSGKPKGPFGLQSNDC